VVVAGGGIAGVEALLGLRELAPEGTELVLVSPARELLHQSLGDIPWSLGGVIRHPIDRICAELGVEHVSDALVGVDAGRRRIELRQRGEAGYDALLVAVGARRIMSLDHAVMFASSLDVPAINEVLALVHGGQARRLAVVVPPRWPGRCPRTRWRCGRRPAGGRRP
jgi:sulfide:quinone oxidoreductase